MTLLVDSVVDPVNPLKQTFGDSDTIDPSRLLLAHPCEMTRHRDAAPVFIAQQSTPDDSWAVDLSFHGQSFAVPPTFQVPASDATKSPASRCHQQSSVPSEDTGSPFSQIVYTPNSPFEYDAPVHASSDRALEDEDDASRSPLSDSIFSSTTDSSFLFVSRPENGEIVPMDRPLSRMDPRPQPATSISSARHSRASSVAKSSTSHMAPSMQADAIASVGDGLMNSNGDDLPAGSFNDSFFDSDFFHGQTHHLMTDLVIPGTDMGNARNVTQNSFRALNAGDQQAFDTFAYPTGTPFNPPVPVNRQLREQQHYPSSQYQQLQNALFRQQMLHQSPSNVTNYYLSGQGDPTSFATTQAPVNGSAAMPVAWNGSMAMRPQPAPTALHQPRATSNVRAAPYPQPYQQYHGQASVKLASHQTRATNTTMRNSIAPSRRAHLAPREDTRPHVLPSNAPAAAVQSGLTRKGGRMKHSHLKDEARLQTSKMRGVTACWRCALQRDRCDDGVVCRRCTIRSQKGGRDHFGCDRSKLPEWIEDLLPDSMTDMHSRRSIETYVNDQVVQWNTGNCIDIYLTSGYGPPLMWRCCEFRPKTHDLLGQLQYLHKDGSGGERRRRKYSPPFALEKLDENDDAQFREYLDNQLMHPKQLETLGWIFYQSECIIDPQYFQTQALELMCTLFSETKDPQLRDALQDIIRMLIVTYIMGHTLTIIEETLPTVLTSVRFTPPQTRAEEFTSPRLANRQLKHYFSSLRHNAFLKVLHRQQQTFHDSKKKEAHWLVSFCAMLGLAMVLEETQITIQIQADAKIVNKEMSEQAANAEALENCKRIDAKFERLVFYFQKKYRDKKWGDDGSFGRGTPRYGTLPESKFLMALYGLVVQRQAHLHARAGVPAGTREQCNYTTRLVAKFLLPFLNLAT